MDEMKICIQSSTEHLALFELAFIFPLTFSFYLTEWQGMHHNRSSEVPRYLTRGT
jgi:hypothetical protein